MSFPGTYNISYYKGDTFEFKLYPKDANAAAFSFSGYTAVFTMSVRRGALQSGDAAKIVGYVDTTATDYILCTITPTNGALMSAGTTYYYDVQITKAGSPYAKTYTLLTGQISVTDEVASI